MEAIGGGCMKIQLTKDDIAKLKNLIDQYEPFSVESRDYGIVFRFKKENREYCWPFYRRDQMKEIKV